MHLDDIVARKRADFRSGPIPTLTAGPRSTPAIPGTFADALRRPEVAIIAEVKPKSPSKGDLIPASRAVPIARTYAASGAAAVSVLADTPFFGGSPQLVADIAADADVTVPVLYKDFVVDLRQVRLAYDAGADGILVIVRAIDDALLTDVLQLAAELGLDQLVEAFTEDEIGRALAAGATIVGINNRDLQTFEVDLDRSAKLRTLIPDSALAVSESGINSRADVERVAGHGFDACLVGENLLTAADIPAALAALTGVASRRAAA